MVSQISGQNELSVEHCLCVCVLFSYRRERWAFVGFVDGQWERRIIAIVEDWFEGTELQWKCVVLMSRLHRDWFVMLRAMQEIAMLSHVPAYFRASNALCLRLITPFRSPSSSSSCVHVSLRGFGTGCQQRCHRWELLADSRTRLSGRQDFRRRIITGALDFVVSLSIWFSKKDCMTLFTQLPSLNQKIVCNVNLSILWS